MYRRFIKRVVDIFFSVIGILVFALPMLIIAIIVKIDSPGPIMFKQKRIGYKGQEFTIFKFRTMCVGAEKMGFGVYSNNNDPRITKVGNFLRKTSLDEIPQFFNTFIGTMSFVGPRPPLTYHPWPIDQYTDEQRKMFNVRPGITGWAQINGRKGVEWTQRIKMNVWYAEHVSFWLDFKIVFRTVGKVFSNADNENHGETVTASESNEKEHVHK